MTKPVQGTVSTPFDEMRPLSNPHHVHGAIDIAAPVGTQIVAPEDGILSAYVAIRNEDGIYWPGTQGPQIHRFHSLFKTPLFPWRNYFYDMYGGILILECNDRVHVFAHCYMNQLRKNPHFNSPLVNWVYTEEREDKRWPIHCYHTLDTPVGVKEGDVIGEVGNAGFSTGAHVHWEIHPGTWKWAKWEERINPEIFL